MRGIVRFPVARGVLARAARQGDMAKSREAAGFSSRRPSL